MIVQWIRSIRFLVCQLQTAILATIAVYVVVLVLFNGHTSFVKRKAKVVLELENNFQRKTLRRSYPEKIDHLEKATESYRERESGKLTMLKTRTVLPVSSMGTINFSQAAHLKE